MQKSHLFLREIIWELTGRCENHCSYCGSKECWNEKINEDRICLIADRIVEYGGVPAIDISGGDPTLVSYETHQYITKELKSVDTICKILFNPKSLVNNKIEAIEILKLYNWIGISINTQEEIDLYHKHMYDIPPNLTFITNFNLQNIFLFNSIKNLVKKAKRSWQIQYTTYKETQNPLAIYNDLPSSSYLFKMMNDAIDEGVEIIPADDMNTGKCGAGSSSIGILANGDVVPCLSMRSWMDDINPVIQDNIIRKSLKDIWEQGFAKYRFDCFECCKDRCHNPFVRRLPEGKLVTNWKEDMPVVWIKDDENTGSPNITVYAVSKPTMMMYGVFNTTSTNPNFPKEDISNDMLTMRYGFSIPRKKKK